MGPTANPQWYRVERAEDVLLPPTDPTGRGREFLDLTGNVIGTQGPVAGLRFEEFILPWQERTILRGWGDTNPSGNPAITEIGIKCGKGSGKSFFVASISIAQVIDWALRGINTRCHVIIVAAGVESALLVFNHAREAIAADPYLANKFRSNISRKEITHIASGIAIRAISPYMENAIGVRTGLLIADELHAASIESKEFAAVIDQLKRGGQNSEEFRQIGITTAAVARPEGYYKSWLQRMRAIRDGTLIDPSVLPVLFELPNAKVRPDIDAADSRFWFFGMPSMITQPGERGTMNAEAMERELIEAAQAADAEGPATMELLLSQRLGIEATDRAGGSGTTRLADYWAQCHDPAMIVPEHSPTFVAMDPSSGLDDPFALVVLMTSGGHYYVWSRQHLLRATYEQAPKRLKEVYDAAIKAEELFLFDSTSELEQAVLSYCRGLLRTLAGVRFGGDGWGLAGFAAKFANEVGAQFEIIPQNWQLPAALDRVSAVAHDRMLHHGNQPLLGANVANLILENGRLRKYDASSSGVGSAKIDGAMALISATQMAESGVPVMSTGGMIG